jgi:hypothetical protein
MATYYVDLALGNDTTGNGTAGNPYLTPNKALSLASGPHDVRVAKTTAAAATGVGTTLTWTNNSQTVSTSGDLTGSISAGNLIGKPTAAGNGASETYYKVASITAAAITLVCPYGGSTGTTDGCLLVTPVSVAGTYVVYFNYTAGDSVSGGWNLSGTPAQDGETWAIPDGATEIALGITKNSCTLSKMNLVSQAATTVTATTRGLTVSYCTIHQYGNFFSGGSANSSYSISNSVIHMNASLTYMFISTGPSYSGEKFTIDTCSLYAPNAASSYVIYVNGNNVADSYVINNLTAYGFQYGIYGVSSNNFYFKFTGTNIIHSISGFSSSGNNNGCENITFKQSYSATNSYGINISQYGYSHIFDNITIVDMAYGTSHTQDQNSIYSNITMQNCGTCIVYESNAYNLKFTNVDLGTPVTAGITIGLLNKPFHEFVNFSIHSSKDSVAINNTAQTSANWYWNPVFILRNCFNNYPDGQYFSTMFMTKSNFVKMGNLPALKMEYVYGRTINYNQWTRIMESYTESGAGKTYSFYAKREPLWFGSIGVRWTLNRTLIKTETTISSLTDDWVKYEYTVADGLVTADGNLALELQYNANTFPVYFDKPSIDSQASVFMYQGTHRQLNSLADFDIVLDDIDTGFDVDGGGYSLSNDYNSRWSAYVG